MKLFCLPYAGGGATPFRVLKDKLSARIVVVPMCLPGREYRFAEPLVDELEVLLPLLVRDYLREERGPYALYGHSMGALIGFELIRYLSKHKLPLPLHFFAAARGAPALSGEYEHFSGLDDADFITRIEAFGGIPEKIVQNREIMSMVLPILRSDFRLLDRYQYLDNEPLPVPITSLRGESDATVRDAWMRAWQYETVCVYRHHTIPGNHFFINDPQSLVFDIIADTLEGIAASPLPDTTCPSEPVSLQHQHNARAWA